MNSLSGLQDRLNELFTYHDGYIYWNENRGSQKCKGKIAGTLCKKGYWHVRARELGGSMLVHRVIWAMHYGEVPEFLDHINLDSSDNRIENLRPATRSQNNHNRDKLVTNTSGYKNVSWWPVAQKWGVNMFLNRKKRWFGYFDDIELADLVATEAREKYHGEYARHGSL